MHVRLPERISRLQHILPFTLTVLAFLLASLGQSYLNKRVHEEWAVALFVLALALTLIAFLQLPEQKEEVSVPASRWKWRGMLALLIASLPACIASALLVLSWNNLPRAIPLYVLSLGAAGYVCYRWEGWSMPRPTLLKEHWEELILVALVLACGLFLRLYRLDYYPPAGSISWNDEAQIGKDAYGIIHHGYLPWQFPNSVYATFLSFQVLGPTVLALRLPFVLLGFLTLIFFYLLARELFRFPVALAATFLFAVSRWHIAFVRLVLPSTPAMLLEVATFYLLLRGRRTGGMMNYILAGLSMGLGLYSH
ncbi:MAG: ArnT family glycosyltransferase, partial [Candidatus Hodarchaeota archaeon]